MASTSAPATPLSDYEKLRLQKIKRNEDRMKELGLFQTRDAIRKAKPKRKQRVSPELPQRRSSRKRNSVVNYSTEQVIPMYSDEEEEDNEIDELDQENDNEDNYDLSEDEDKDGTDVEDDDGELSYLQKPRKKRKTVATKTEELSSQQSGKASPGTMDTTTFECINPTGGLTLEYAKTSRSTCRKCRVKIEKGKPRVGMEAWIVGRNCITWQCPQCLFQNLCVAYEKSNRSRCKATNVPFQKGQLKIGIRCHTATSYYHVGVVEGVLKNVMALMKTDNDSEYELGIDGVDGSEKLSKDDKGLVEQILKTILHSDENRSENPNAKVKEESTSAVEEPPGRLVSKAREQKKAKHQQQEQPKVGVKTGAKGKVEWKFGGRTCYGTLMASKETKTHCYARTHKGNVKTLAKGKDYWSMIA